MLRELNYIELSGEKFPIRIDNIVLQHIQKEYGMVNDFELLLIGAEKRKIEDDKIVIVKTKEPSIEAINFIVPKMINEGMEIKGIDTQYEETELIRMIDIEYYELAEIIHQELMRCFITKKQKPSQNRKMNLSRLTLTGYILLALQKWDFRRTK